MEVKELFVDMDGVLCAFEKRFTQLFHEPSQVNYPESNNAKAKRYKKEFKEFIEGNNFATLEPMPDFHQAVLFLNRVVKKTHVYILSSTANEEYLPEISRQKKEWLKKYDINFPSIFVPGKRLKQIYSGKNRVLIDDTYSTIQQWNYRGGCGIYHTNWKESIKEFNNLIE